MLKMFLYTGVLLLCSAFFAPSLIAQNKQSNDTTVAKSEMKTIHLEVTGMSCQGCADGLDAKFKKIRGVMDSKTVFKNSSCKITFDQTVLGEQKIMEIIEKRGFKAISKDKDQE